MFCLCKTCAIEMRTDRDCTHETVQERALMGTWVLDEVRLAVEKGYQIINVHEVFEDKVTRYDPATGDGGLFVEYIKALLKLKAEASGYPNWVRCPEDEERYVREFHNSEGVLLERDAIRPNAAKRALSKLCLNSLWGKLTERNNRTKTKMVTEPRELYRFLSTPGIEVSNLMFVSDEAVWVSWSYTAEEKVPTLKHTNEVIGAYVTAGARMHLYKYLDRLGERTLYCDTDSLLYRGRGWAPTCRVWRQARGHDKRARRGRIYRRVCQWRP